MTTSSQVFAATVTRDYVPVVANTTAGDPRLLLLGSHYQQQDSAGTAIGGASHNETASAITIDGHTYPAANEAGGDKLNTPKTAKEKLRAAVPARARVVIYKTPQEFNAAINHNQEMDWIYAELRTLPDPPAPSKAALRKA